MSYPKYKLGDIVRFAGAICEVTACKDCTLPLTMYRDCCNANYKYDLKYSDGVTFGYNVSEDEISPVEEEGEEKMANFKYNIGDRVIYTGSNTDGGLCKDQEYIVCDHIPAEVNYKIENAYRLKYPDQTKVWVWVLEEDLTTAWEKEAEDDKEEVIKEDFKYNIGDRVIYTGPTLGRVQKGQEYIIKSAYPSVPTVTDGGYQNAYQLETVDGLRVPSWVLEEDLTTAWEKEAEDDIKITEDSDDSGDFKYDIDDHVFFNGHEQVIVRKMHIGLNKYYKIRHVDDDSTHCYIVSEYALDKNCITKKEDDILNAPTKEYHLNKKGISKVSGEFHPTGDTGFVGGFIKASSDREIDARDKSSMLPNLMRTYNIYQKGIRVIDEGLEDKYHDYKYNMTIMVSQPLSNKSKEEVEKIRNAAIMSFVYSENVPKPEDAKPYYIRVVDNLQYDRIPTEDEGELNHFDYLSTDIKLMKDIDFIVFAYGWQNSNGCNIEYQMAKTYGIPMYFV